MYNESNNRLAAVEAVLERMAINAERRNAEDERRNADFALKMQDLRESQDRTDKQMAQTDKQLKILTQQGYRHLKKQQFIFRSLFSQFI